uniref:Transposase n=1 Tax=Macrostomum lignano TaxID=282301 RepID=A0A1I8GF14_9PLAT
MPAESWAAIGRTAQQDQTTWPALWKQLKTIWPDTVSTVWAKAKCQPTRTTPEFTTEDRTAARRRRLWLTGNGCRPACRALASGTSGYTFVITCMAKLTENAPTERNTKNGTIKV